MDRKLVFNLVGKIIPYFALLIVIYSVLFVWKSGLVRKLFSVTVYGQVFDISENSPVELVPVSGSGQTTYTDYLGVFRFEFGRRRTPELHIGGMTDFEPFTKSIDCRQSGGSFIEPRYECRADLYPQPFEVARRILSGEAAVGFSERQLRESNKKSIWSRSAKLSRSAFGKEEDFVSLLADEEEIRIKMKEQLIKYTVENNFKILDKFDDPLSGKVLSGVAEVPVVRFYADGTKESGVEHFVKENGIWRYLIPFSREALSRFVENNKWVLKLPN